MTAIVFAGPSLAGADAAMPMDFVLAPPARQGDVYRAAQMRPAAIGIIDGYFEGVPSVWHKEILWALSRGIPVYGSASIGALRAAEMQSCGMIGVGEIFSAYHDGVLEADDEVALLHGPAEAGFLGLTEPLVNVRATCRAAIADGAVADEEAGPDHRGRPLDILQGKDMARDRPAHARRRISREPARSISRLACNRAGRSEAARRAAHDRSHAGGPWQATTCRS